MKTLYKILFKLYFNFFKEARSFYGSFYCDNANGSSNCINFQDSTLKVNPYCFTNPTDCTTAQIIKYAAVVHQCDDDGNPTTELGDFIYQISDASFLEANNIAVSATGEIGSAVVNFTFPDLDNTIKYKVEVTPIYLNDCTAIPEEVEGETVTSECYCHVEFAGDAIVAPNQRKVKNGANPRGSKSNQDNSSNQEGSTNENDSSNQEDSTHENDTKKQNENLKRIAGVGPNTEKVLKAAKLNNIENVANSNTNVLDNILKKAKLTQKASTLIQNAKNILAAFAICFFCNFLNAQSASNPIDVNCTNGTNIEITTYCCPNGIFNVSIYDLNNNYQSEVISDFSGNTVNVDATSFNTAGNYYILINYNERYYVNVSSNCLQNTSSNNCAECFSTAEILDLIAQNALPTCSGNNTFLSFNSTTQQWECSDYVFGSNLQIVANPDSTTTITYLGEDYIIGSNSSSCPECHTIEEIQNLINTSLPTFTINGSNENVTVTPTGFDFSLNEIGDFGGNIDTINNQLNLILNDTVLIFNLNSCKFEFDDAVANSTTNPGVVFNGTGEKVATFNGDINVTGLIDPTGLQYSAVQTDAEMPNGTDYVTDGSASGLPSGTRIFKDFQGNYHNLEETSVFVNGIEVNQPNFIDGNGITYTINGSNVIANFDPSTLSQIQRDSLCEINSNCATAIDEAPEGTLLKTGEVATTWNVGETIVYTFQLCNNGQIPITNGTFSDFTPGITIPEFTYPIAPNQCDEVTANYLITAADVAAGQIFNLATGTIQNNSSFPPTELSSQPDLSGSSAGDPTIIEAPLAIVGNICNTDVVTGLQSGSVVTTPTNCGGSDSYIVGPPDDQAWVNLFDNEVITADFQDVITYQNSGTIVFENAFNPTTFDVELQLSDNSYSTVQTITTAANGQANTTYQYFDGSGAWANCTQEFTSPNIGQYCATADLSSFGLTNSDQIKGVRVTVIGYTSPNQGDLSGIYISQ